MNPKIIAIAPWFRIWNKKERTFPEGILIDSNYNMYSHEINSINTDGLSLELWTGRFAKDGTAIYQNDIVVYGVLNEFGSFVESKGVIRYSQEYLAFVFEEDTQMQTDEFNFLEFIRVEGHA